MLALIVTHGARRHRRGRAPRCRLHGPGVGRAARLHVEHHDPRPKPAHRRALTTAAPLRLWIAGDSLAGSIGPSLGQLTADTGVVAPQYDSRVSSGLLTPDFFDWPQHAQEQLAQLDPEAVVFVIGTNDANVWSPNLAADYRLRTEAMMRELVGKDHRTVYWVGPPVAKDRDLEAGVKAVVRDRARGRRARQGRDLRRRPRVVPGRQRQLPAELRQRARRSGR